MKFQYLHFLLAILLAGSIQAARAGDYVLFTLDEALLAATKRSDVIEELQYLELKLNGNLESPNAAYDWAMYGEGTYIQDRQEQPNPFSNQAARYISSIGAKKLFETGTALDVSVDYNYTKLNPPPAQPGQPSFFPLLSYNEMVVRVDASQSLTKNWLGRMIDARKALIADNSPKTKLAKEIELQGTLAQVESLFVELQAIDARISVLSDSLGLFDELAKIARRKINQGRAEKTDLLSALSSKDSQSHQITSLKAARRSLVVLLADLLGTEYGTNISVPTIDYDGLPTLPDSEEIVTKALGNRADKKLEERTFETARINVEQARIDTMPDVNVFGGVFANAIDPRFPKSVPDLFDDGENISWQVGVKGEWKVGKNSALEAAEKVAKADKLIAELKIRRIERDVRKAVFEAYTKIENSKLLLKSLMERSEGLKLLEAEERRLYRISRGDAALVIARRQELVGVERERVEAYVDARKAVAALRAATHDYPMPAE